MKNQKYLFPLFLVLYEFTVYLSNDMIMPGMVQVIKDFHVGESYIPQSLTLFLLGGATLQVLLGPISDRHGRRPVMLLGVAFFFLCTVLAIFTNSIGQFLALRFFQGMGNCFIYVIGYSSVQDMYEEKDAIKLISLMTLIALVSPLIGPLAGGLYCQFFSWHGIFVITGSIALVAFVGLLIYMPETASMRQVSLVDVIHNYRRVITNKKFMFGTIAMGMSVMPLLAWIAISPVVLIEKAKLSSAAYGICQIPVFGFLMAGNMVLRKIIDNIEVRSAIIYGAGIAVGGLLLCCVLPLVFGEAYWWILIPISLYSIGVAISNAPLARRILFSSDVTKGTVSAVIGIMHVGILAIGTFVTSFIYATQSNVILGMFFALAGVALVPLLWLFLRDGK